MRPILSRGAGRKHRGPDHDRSIVVKILVTGGAGFIGTSVVRHLLADGASVVNLDKLTYAGNLENLAALDGNARHVFVRGDLCDRAPLDRLCAERPFERLSLLCSREL